MTKQEFLNIIPGLKKISPIFSQVTKMPMVFCHEETMDDYIYVYLNEDNKILIAFLYKAGFPDEDQYLFYSSGGQELIEENLNKSLYESITKKDENWYFVQFY